MITAILQNTLRQLDQLLAELSPENYQREDEILSGSSIGMHVRHILEFVNCVVLAKDNQIVCYDDRKRDINLQTDLFQAREFLASLVDTVKTINPETKVSLRGCYGCKETEYNLNSTIERELAYNIEHAIHHMAMIKIAVKALYPHISIAPDFGVAHSTLTHAQLS